MNFPSPNGHYLAMGNDDHRTELTANGNVLAIYYNTLDKTWPTNDAATAAASINQWVMNNFTNTGPRPDWIVLNEIASSTWTPNPSYRTWIRDVVHALKTTYGYTIIVYAPYTNPVGTAADWQGLASDAYIGIENYLSGQEISAQSFSVSWCQGQYSSSLVNYSNFGVSPNRLILGEHFAQSTNSTGFGRSGVSSNNWDSAIIARSRGATNVAFAGFIGYSWGANGMNVSQDEMIHFEDTYATNPLPRKTSVTLPYIIDQPLSQSAVWKTNVSFSVMPAGKAPLGYQWRLNGATIPGATNQTLTLTNIGAANAGAYSVMLSNVAGTTLSSNAVLTIFMPDDHYQLSKLWSLAPGSAPYATGSTNLSTSQTPLQRGIAYNALSNQVYIVSRSGATTGLNINVLDGSTGMWLYSLDTTGISGGAIVLLEMMAAADGALYAANLDVSGGTTPSTFRLYRWTNSSPTTKPIQVFQGEPAGQATAFRWGDAMDLRGTGTNTQLIIDSQLLAGSVGGPFAAILTPSSGAMNQFVTTALTEPNGSGSLGRSLQFGAGNTFWQKRKGTALMQLSYDLTNHNSTLLMSVTNLPAALGPVAIDLARGFLAGLSFSGNSTQPDAIELYEIQDLSNPVLIARYNFPTNELGNANFIGQIVINGDRLYACDGNNGFLAFSIIPPVIPKLHLNLSNDIISIAWTNSVSGWNLQKTINLSAANSWTNFSQLPGQGMGTLTITDSVTQGSVFYRLRKP
ncbi:immunoglobulin domain-containing protein [Pedosphaera parvula]|nr:immunoglobulin domain-containing protein [Pedosphaera parvula]